MPIRFVRFFLRHFDLSLLHNLFTNLAYHCHWHLRSLPPPSAVSSTDAVTELCICRACYTRSLSSIAIADSS
ncbi:hypothetical protein V6N13_058925 [Hibiscus sabdariffa]|uniref:Secreted protein n=1 Tax=Hibiscus sabdariffa TaxID=183260 RepID=A0ABR2GEP4_9ROSI